MSRKEMKLADRDAGRGCGRVRVRWVVVYAEGGLRREQCADGRATSAFDAT